MALEPFPAGMFPAAFVVRTWSFPMPKEQANGITEARPEAKVPGEPQTPPQTHRRSPVAALREWWLDFTDASVPIRRREFQRAGFSLIRRREDVNGKQSSQTIIRCPDGKEFEIPRK